MALKFNYDTVDMGVNEKAKTLLFARWLSMQYSTTLLNEVDGIWWLKTMNHFETVVLPNYKENGSYDDMVAFINKNGDMDMTSRCNKCGKEIEFHKTICNECEVLDLPF